MADQQIPFEYQTAFGDAAEQERIAQLLLKMQAQQRPALAGSMVSNRYVKPSMTQYMADLFQSYQSGQAQNRAADIRRGVTQRMAGDESNQLRDVLHAASGTPAGNDVGPPDADGSMGYSSGVPPDLAKAATIAAGSKFPNVQKMGDDLRSRWSTQMNVGAPGATDASRVAASQTGRPSDFQPKPEDTFNPPGNVAPPGMRPVIGQTNQRTGKVAFGPGEPVNVSMNAARADQQLVNEHYKMLMDPKMRQTAESSSTAMSVASQALNIIAKVPLNMGQGAGLVTEVQKAAKWFGKTIDPRAPASEVYASLIVPMVGAAIKDFGAGTGLSDADREFASKSQAMLERDPRAAQAILMEVIKRSWKYATNYNRMAGAGEGLAKDAGMNPEIFKSIVLPIQFTVAKETGLSDNPWDWPDAFGSIDQQLNQPAPAAPQGPVRKRWGGP